MSKRILVTFSILLLIASKGFSESSFANQRFIDNALQFDDEEGVRTHVERVDSKAVDSLVVIEVVSSNSEAQPQRKPKKAAVGMSFTDMASDVQGGKKSSGGMSFGDLAKAARGGKPKEAVVVPTKNIGAVQRLFPTAATPAPSKPVPKPKKAVWKSEEP